MPTRLRIAFSLFISVSLLSSATASDQVQKGSSGFRRYLNPQQTKNYVNESQDRTIKRKAFKAADVPSAAVATNPELGFFIAVPADKLSDLSFCDQLLAKNTVNGLSVAFPWAMIEPSEDNFNWQPVDQLLLLCKNHHKAMILRVTTCGVDVTTPGTAGADAGSDTPKWVYDAGVKSLAYQSADGAVRKMPIFWDKNYLAKWSNFVSEMAERYDKDPTIQSIGITGGGFGTGTPIATDDIEPMADILKRDHGMTERQLVEHWKYVADLFPKRFSSARLNFNVNAPVRGKAGEDALDEIADYLVYRYGQRVYLTREGFGDGKHNFNDFRLLLKFHNDTLTGIRIPEQANAGDMNKIVKHALDDGISFAELPVSAINSTDRSVQAALQQLLSHIGYKLVCQEATVPSKIRSGEPLKAAFSFMNVGTAPAMRPERNLDKDTPMSYRVGVELRNPDGQPVLRNIHTPPTPTSKWSAGKAVVWEETLKMSDADKHQLPAGEYTVWMTVIDPTAKRNISFLQATTDGKIASVNNAQIGKLTVTSAVADTEIQTRGEAQASDKR